MASVIGWKSWLGRTHRSFGIQPNSNGARIGRWNIRFGGWARWRCRGWLLAVVVSALVLLLAGCTLNMATGRRQLNVLSPAREIALGQEAAPQFLAKLGGEISSGPIQQYVAEIGHRLAVSSERSSLPWQFKVVDSQVLNAFALPGGKVFVSRGLLAKLADESMLAAVLAHEIGHTTAKHIGEQMTQQMILSGAVAVAESAARRSDSEWLGVLGVGAQFGNQLYFLRFSRDQEIEADKLALRYMTHAGYKPTGMVRVLEVLAQEADLASGPRMLSTHPDPAERLRRAARYVARHFANDQDLTDNIVNGCRYRQMVLLNLANLPPAKHRGS